MIKQLQGHISDEEIVLLKNIIIDQYKQYLQFVNSLDYRKLFRKEYASHKKQHSISWAISSAFPGGSTVANSFDISCLKYGKGHTRPELKNERIIIHVLNHTTHFKAKYLRPYYELNRNNTNKVLYCYIKFQAEQNQLTKVDLCFPDATGKVIASETLLNNSQIIKLCA